MFDKDSTSARLMARAELGTRCVEQVPRSLVAFQLRPASMVEKYEDRESHGLSITSFVR